LKNHPSAPIQEVWPNKSEDNFVRVILRENVRNRRTNPEGGKRYIDGGGRLKEETEGGAESIYFYGKERQKPCVKGVL